MPPTPAELGYYYPAEWTPHVATWISWPHNPATWPDKIEPVPAVFAAFVRAVAAHEPVHILAGRESVMRQARELVGSVPNVTLQDIATNDAWIRDYGPLFLTSRDDRPPAMVDFRYNAWGGKYPPFDLDDRATAKINDMLGMKRFEPLIILEGGSIDVNGRGALLTTESCLLNPNRNPHLDRGQVERYLADYLAATHVIWLHGDMAGDDTDGHIDQLARFVDEWTVVAMVEEDRSDENYEPLQENWRRLQLATDQDGRPLTILPLPMPRAKYHDGQRLPASYANFYIANGGVVVPTFDDPADAVAIQTLARCFPTRRIEPINAIDLIWGLGAFHCMTQQQAAC
ncbi:MAG: agmatine deiminase family protein [Pirellulales bacterium]